MSVSSSFIDLVKDALGGFGPVSVHRLFGGAGLYADGAMFGLVAGDALYLKADEVSKADFAAEGMEPFGYMAAGKRRVIPSFWRAPERLLDDPEEMSQWARRALAAAKRATKGARRGGRAARRVSA